MLSPSELDKQSPISISRWIDIESQEAKDMDPDIKLTKKWFKLLSSSNDLVADSNGRIWGKGENSWYPYHFNIGKVNYGYRLSRIASN